MSQLVHHLENQGLGLHKSSPPPCPHPHSFSWLIHPTLSSSNWLRYSAPRSGPLRRLTWRNRGPASALSRVWRLSTFAQCLLVFYFPPASPRTGAPCLVRPSGTRSTLLVAQSANVHRRATARRMNGQATGAPVCWCHPLQFPTQGRTCAPGGPHCPAGLLRECRPSCPTQDSPCRNSGTSWTPGSMTSFRGAQLLHGQFQLLSLRL